MTSTRSGRDHPLSVRVSSRCTDTNGCVGVATTEDGVAVIDTKDVGVTPLRFTREEWAAFVAGVKNGEFDLS